LFVGTNKKKIWEILIVATVVIAEIVGVVLIVVIVMVAAILMIVVPVMAVVSAETVVLALNAARRTPFVSGFVVVVVMFGLILTMEHRTTLWASLMIQVVRGGDKRKRGRKPKWEMAISLENSSVVISVRINLFHSKIKFKSMAIIKELSHSWPLRMCTKLVTVH